MTVRARRSSASHLDLGQLDAVAGQLGQDEVQNAETAGGMRLRAVDVARKLFIL